MNNNPKLIQQEYLIEIKVQGQLFHKQLVKDSDDVNILTEVLRKIERNAKQLLQQEPERKSAEENQINYMQVIDQSDEEKMAMYMKLPKEEIVSMLIECNKVVDGLKPIPVFQPQAGGYSKEQLLKHFKDFFTFHNEANKDFKGIDELFNQWYYSKHKTIEPQVQENKLLASDITKHIRQTKGGKEALEFHIKYVQPLLKDRAVNQNSK